ncbi:LysR family transcriptional regulator [Streptomyces antioxidans]|uniref:LysR family transcriptional regulator n=1 Tax=Streptomyces antioxidans TaxID=1507734 RepID=UPI001301EF83|nr:LysR family transcriptional regulator [Streptomyces antioxidans]
MSLSRLRLLLALHERGTLQAAASALHISTSAASQQLAALTREAGARLTEMDGRRLRLTDAGRVLVEHAYAVFARLERAQGDVRAAADGELGQLTVGAFPSAIATLLIPAVRVARERHPRLRVDLREVEVPAGLDQLSTGDLDLVVGVEGAGTQPPDDQRYARLPLGVDDFLLAVPLDHPSARGPAAVLSHLADQEWVGTREGDSCDQLLHGACLAAGFRPMVRHRAADWTAILALVEAGMGLTLLPSSARIPVPAAVRVVPVAERISRHVYVAVRQGGATHPAVAAYLAALEQVAADVFDEVTGQPPPSGIPHLGGREG